MVKLIIFDFDGVIITGSNEGHFTCYHKALEAVGVRLGPKEEKKRILEDWGKGYRVQLESLLREHLELLPKAIKAYENCYYSPIFSQNIRLIDGAKTVLEKLSQRHALAIASGMMRKTMDVLIKKFNISYFDKIMTNEDIKRRQDLKPSPFMINRILNDLLFRSEETIFIGDAKNDVIMAQKANVLPIVVLTGHLNKKEAEELGVQYIIPNVTHLEKVLSKL